MSLEARGAHARDQLQSVQDNEPDDEIERLRREVQKWRDEANELEDCREALRRLGHFCGCDHVESADEREQQERHIEEAFTKLADERDSFRDRVHQLESEVTRLRDANGKMVAICKAAQDVCESSSCPHLPSIERLRNAGKDSGINFENAKQVEAIAGKAVTA